MAVPNRAPDHLEDDEAEVVALNAAITEAEGGGPAVPHAVVRARLLDMIAEAESRIETLAQENVATHSTR